MQFILRFNQLTNHLSECSLSCGSTKNYQFFSLKYHQNAHIMSVITISGRACPWTPYLATVHSTIIFRIHDLLTAAVTCVFHSEALMARFFSFQAFMASALVCLSSEAFSVWVFVLSFVVFVCFVLFSLSFLFSRVGRIPRRMVICWSSN